MTFGAPVAEAEAIILTHWALDNGINFIDTANMYEGYARYVGLPGGVSEAILGKALSGCGECCGLPMPAYRSCANCEFHAELSSPKI